MENNNIKHREGIQIAMVHDGQARIKVREAGEGGSESRIVEGYAIVFDKPSVVLNDWWDGPYREYVDKDAISQEMLDGCDIQMTAYHNREILLARHWPDGSGTLKCEVRDEGVWVSFEAPQSPNGDNILEAVKRGDMQGMSFSFRENAYTFEDVRGQDGITERHIRHFSEIFEMTIASNPAYPDTTAEARELELAKAKEKAEAKEREKRNAEAINKVREMAKKRIY